MCGIAGIISRSDSADSLVRAVSEMSDAQRHRGPNGGTVTVASAHSPAAVLGHRRLAIIDLSEAGAQPMIDAITGVILTYNGEIYNFRELRSVLEAAGHRFISDTDTEVILRGYVEWGMAMPARLRGIFAFSLWDPRQRLALLVRDGLGVKPLYVHTAGGDVTFASEVRAMLASGRITRRLDLDGLRSYLAFGSVQEPMTLIQEVRSLAPGSMLIVDDQGWRERRFHELPGDDPHRALPGREALRRALGDAVTAQLVADVPLGAFLSGGIDSSAISILMGDGGAEVRTFNVCFEDAAALDERVYARQAAAAAQSTHTEIELGEREFLEHLPAALAAYDQPSVDGINTWFVSRAVRDAGLTVALAGVGGDELFVGYNRFAKAQRAQHAHSRVRFLPRSVRRVAGKWLELGARRESLRQAGALLASELDPYFSIRRLFGPHRSDSFLHPSLRAGGGEIWTENSFGPLRELVEGVDQINKISRLELRTYMLSTLLRDTDQMSMAHTLEVRVPLIDHSLVDVVLPLPGRHKTSATVPKRLLVEPLEAELPPECVYRTKRGFVLPLEKWLTSPTGLRQTSERLGGYQSDVWPLDSKAMAKLRQDHARGITGWSRVWALYVLRDWLVRHQVSG